MNNMHIIIDELSVMQAKLDEFLHGKFEVENPKEVVDEKLLALKVELGELANESKCFKYWSVKPGGSYAKLLEEYSDCLHFTLGIGLVHNYLLDFDTGKRIFYREYDIKQQKEYSKALTHQFNKTFKAIAYFEYEDPAYSAYLMLLQAVINLGSMLGFSEQEIYEGYKAKNEVNYKRQEAGY